ncbi:MAG: zinc ABC transporter substrate-binding protein [Planctomycetota bacterium]
MHTRKTPTARLLLGAALLTAACSNGANEDPRPLVVCTTVMIGDLALDLAGDDARVEVLFGPDVDPHLFRPTRDDVALLLDADLVLWNGLHLESNLQETLERVETDGARVVPVAEVVAKRADAVLMEGDDAEDPHVWMDVPLWTQVAELVADELAALVPGADAGALLERRTTLIAKLEALDAEATNLLNGVPEDRRTLVTAHDAFAYFGRRHGFEVHAIQGISTASEAGLRAIEDLVTLVVEREVPAVFFESTVAERSVRALIEGAEARGHRVTVGGTLHSDAPGEAATYVGMIAHNARTISAALGSTSAASSAPAEVQK